MRASEKSTCHAALSSVQAAITAKAVFAQIQTNYTFINTLKDSLDEPELVLPLPKTAVLQGFAVHGHGNGLAARRGAEVRTLFCPQNVQAETVSASTKQPTKAPDTGCRWHQTCSPCSLVHRSCFRLTTSCS